ncbi:TBC1 domain family member 7 [Eumeta japonica]|uniref:TBC1 domain family member 7 n=1 Tax=Eumeta variegata TaxID=151549 RepID=A0A4C1ZRE2_EUMVA|nr:TBC1 domain family member 7 [Eumeta japonica]
MTTDERNFRSSYYEKVGCRGVEEKKSLEILLKERPWDKVKLKQFCLRFTVPAAHRALVWKVLLGILPPYPDSHSFVAEQRAAQYADLVHALAAMALAEDEPPARRLFAMWQLERGVRTTPRLGFVVEEQIQGSVVGCMLHVNTCCRLMLARALLNCLCLLARTSHGAQATEQARCAGVGHRLSPLQPTQRRELVPATRAPCLLFGESRRDNEYKGWEVKGILRFWGGKVEESYISISEVCLRLLVDEVDAYWVAKALCTLASPAATRDLPMLQELVFSVLLKEEPVLHAHLAALGALAALPLQQWFACCFAGILDDSSLLKIWDKIVCGAHKLLAFVAVVVVCGARRALLAATSAPLALRALHQVVTYHNYSPMILFYW